jgi:hypothetical protein
MCTLSEFMSAVDAVKAGGRPRADLGDPGSHWHEIILGHVELSRTVGGLVNKMEALQMERDGLKAQVSRLGSLLSAALLAGPTTLPTEVKRLVVAGTEVITRDFRGLHYHLWDADLTCGHRVVAVGTTPPWWEENGKSYAYCFECSVRAEE